MEPQTLTREAAVQPLTQHEIDRRIGDVTAQVLMMTGDDKASEPPAGELHPQWISAAELVRRMQPFMVLN